jgi:hypothetical protein
MLAFPDVVHFFPDEFSGLCAGRFTFAGIFTASIVFFSGIIPPLMFRLLDSSWPQPHTW